MTVPILSFWGKASTETDRPGYHPLVWHSLDVAASLELLLGLYPAPLRALDNYAGAGLDAVRAFLLRLACLHDIGKFALGFQSKAAEFFPAALGVLPDQPPLGDHTAIGFRLLTREFANKLKVLAPNIDGFGWSALLLPVCAHHGRPLLLHQIDAALRMPLADIGLPAVEAAGELIQLATQLIEGPPFSAQLSDKDAKRVSWLIAGAINLADWIGSNQTYFCYEPPGDIPSYWDSVARPRAKEALAAAGLAIAKTSPRTGYAELTGSSRPPSPLQVFAAEAPLAQGPQMFLIEDMTGAGKTEAALILAQRLMLSGQGDGLFVALPTMATANAIYDRLGPIYRRLFVDDAKPSLCLAHGASRWHQGFQDSILDFREVGVPSCGGGGDDNRTASAACAAWIADDRRRAFFANVGVGTIDQAFLAVLPSKFAALRQFALSRRILIVDEAHAYGAYEGVELERLLTFHAAHGGSAIVLSATLPEIVKAKLNKAFRLGLGLYSHPLSWPDDYPSATRIEAGQPEFAAIQPRSDLPRKTPVARLENDDEALAQIVSTAGAGGCAAYIRNTVDDVLRADAALRSRGLDPLVFHARFAMCDRQEIEREVLRLFGPQSTPELRAGRILLASQVAEQSLDFDVDDLVSDLAPIDLLIQRAGRLWRHNRAFRPVSSPSVGVVSPAPDPDADPDWFRRAFPKAAYVYANHALLWRGAKSLFEAGEIDAPNGVRALIESVYGPGSLDDAPKGLEGRRSAAEGKAAADVAIAHMNLLQWENGYCSDFGDWEADVLTPTRLGQARTTLRLALWCDGRLTPWAGVPESSTPDATRRAWARSEASIAERRGRTRGAYPTEVEQAAAALERPWRDFGEKAVILPLMKPANDVFAGSLNDGKREIEVSYDRRRGLRFGAAE